MPQKHASENRSKRCQPALPYLPGAPLLLFLRATTEELGQEESFVAHRGFIWRQEGCTGLCASFAILLFLPTRLHAQTKAAVTLSPSSLRPTANYPKPIHYSVVRAPGNAKERVRQEEVEEVSDWSITLSGAYQFLSARSRVGDLSLDSDSAIIDLAFILNCRPYTSFDVSYAYSYASGSSPTGMTQTENQHFGSIRVLQPLEPFGPHGGEWSPPDLSNKKVTNQFAVILDANYGGSLISARIPRLPSIDSTAYTFVGNALLDYQLGWFPCHRPTRSNTPNPDDNYPSLLLEFSSGIQFANIHLSSSDPASAGIWSGRQLTYRNIVSFTGSLRNRLGFLVAAEWDAPLDSDPLHGAQPYYANVAVFTAGLVYNLYPDKHTQQDTPPLQDKRCEHPWSLSLLYSYTAFDPFTETNQLQVQLSYTF